MELRNIIAVVGYMTCSSLMLLVNKLAVHHLPMPLFVLFCQLAFSSLVCRILYSCRYIELETLNWEKASQFWIVSLSFLGTVYANFKILENTNVETFIVFRATTPVLISIADYLFLGRELPNFRSWICLFSLVVGAIGYTLTDNFFQVKAYVWVAIWYLLFSFDQIYIKHKVDTVSMNTWTQVYYSNTLALPFLLLMILFVNPVEMYQTLITFDWTISSTFFLLLSSFMGIGIAFFSFMARTCLSATYFTVIGNSCKIITVLINVFMWDKHASPIGLAFLFGCLIAAYFYQQAPKRTTEVNTNPLDTFKYKKFSKYWLLLLAVLLVFISFSLRPDPIPFSGDEVDPSEISIETTSPSSLRSLPLTNPPEVSKATSSPSIASGEANLAKSYEKRILSALKEYHEEFECTYDTPVFYLDFHEAGFGNIIDWWHMYILDRFLEFMESDKTNRRVVIFIHNHWSWRALTAAQDLMRPSACQKLFDENPQGFRNARLYPQWSCGSVQKVKGFEDIPFAFFARRAFSYFFLPRINLEAINSRGIPVVFDPSLSDTKIHEGRYSFDQLIIEGETFDLTVHIRHGDACTTRKINYLRPPCQPAKEFVLELLKIEKSLGLQFVRIFIASDTQTALDEFNAYLLNDTSVKERKVFSLNLDRSLYNPPGENSKIERFIFEREKQLQAIADYVVDVLMLSKGKVMLGSCYSSLFNQAFFMGVEKGYHCIDKGYPCMRGGCPTPLSERAGTEHDKCQYMMPVYDVVTHRERMELLYRNIYDVSRDIKDQCEVLQRISPSDWDKVYCIGKMQEENANLCLQRVQELN